MRFMAREFFLGNVQGAQMRQYVCFLQKRMENLPWAQLHLELIVLMDSFCVQSLELDILIVQ